MAAAASGRRRGAGADPLGVPAVRGHLAVGVEDDGVHDVGLGGDAHDVLLERGEVVEEQRAVRVAARLRASASPRR